MQITEELIERFLANQCTEEEAEKVSVYLQENPSVLEKYTTQSWEEASYIGELPNEPEVWQVINENTLAQKQPARWRSMPWLKIAASLLLILSAWWIVRPGRSTEVREQTAAVQKEAQAAPATTDREITRVNNTGKALKVQLPDHSTVTLFNGARIKYAAAFTGSKRNIYLEGTAFFDVTKDSTKPFTVYSGRFSTTALGTSFSVEENKSGCTVKLYTGKVVIKTTSTAVEGWKKDVYLSPRQQMHYDALERSVAVAGMTGTEKNSIAKKKETNSNANTDNALVFENTPLPEVMDKLMKRYRIKIEYDQTQIGKKYFSGSVLENDSLPLILNIIARMNRLTIKETPNGFLVSKPQ